MKVNILGILVGALGIFLVFLGITGRYKVFIGGSSSATSSSGGTGIPNPLPNQGDVPSSNTAVPGVTFNTLNQDPVPTVGNLPNSYTQQQQNAFRSLWSLLQHQGSLP